MTKVLGMGMSTITVTAGGKGQKMSLLSPPARFPNLTTVLQPGAGQGIPYPDRGA